MQRKQQALASLQPTGQWRALCATASCMADINSNDDA
jgi:hypothetical protein